MIKFTRLLSGLLCVIFTVASIGNLISIVQGTRMGVTMFGIAGLVAYCCFRALRAGSGERAIGIAYVASICVAGILAVVAFFVLSLAFDLQASLFRGVLEAATSVLFALIAIGVWTRRKEVRQAQTKLAELQRTRAVLEEFKSIRMASGISMGEHIRGVKPPQPVPTENVRTSPALYLSRTGLPVSLNDGARSFFGGLPRLPSHLDWPRQIKHGEPAAYLFVAQIDLEEMAAHLTSPLPGRGTLYFFIDGNNEAPDEGDACVLYFDERADTIPLREPPDTLRPYDLGDARWPWLTSDEPSARIAFKHPLTFTKFQSHCDYELIVGDPPRVRNDIELQQKTHGGDPSTPEPWDVITEASLSWPFTHGVIEHSCRAMLYALDKLQGYQLRDKPAEVIQEFARIRSRAAGWLANVNGSDEFTVCNDETRLAFRNDWLALSAATKKVSAESSVYLYRKPHQLMFDAIHLVCCLCASNDVDKMDLIPKDYLRVLEDSALWRPRYPKSRARSPGTVHQMLGFGMSVQSAQADHTDDLLLLQVCGDPLLSWFPTLGCVLQFWIDPNEAAARRFSVTRLTLECD